VWTGFPIEDVELIDAGRVVMHGELLTC
jgi:hypothetical protein